MYLLKWTHTRKGTPMEESFPTWGAAWLKIATIRAIYPKHQFTLNGQPI